MKTTGNIILRILRKRRGIFTLVPWIATALSLFLVSAPWQAVNAQFPGFQNPEEEREEALPILPLDQIPHRIGFGLSTITGVEIEYSENVTARQRDFGDTTLSLSGTSFHYEYIQNFQFGFEFNFSKYVSTPGTVDISEDSFDVRLEAMVIGFRTNIYFDLTKKRGLNQLLGLGINYGIYDLLVDGADDGLKERFSSSYGAQLNQIHYGINYNEKIYGLTLKIGLLDGNAFSKSAGSNIGTNIVMSGTRFISADFQRKF